MEKTLRITYKLLAALFFIFAVLTFIAFVFYVFGMEPLGEVRRTLLTSIVFLFSYIVVYRIYTLSYKKDDYKTLAERMDDLEDETKHDNTSN